MSFQTKVHGSDGPNGGNKLVVESGGEIEIKAGGTISGIPLKTLTGVGASAAGPVTLTGAEVGDRVLAVIGAPTAGGAFISNPAAAFESVVTVADQIQQEAESDLDANTYVFFLISAAA